MDVVVLLALLSLFELSHAGTVSFVLEPGFSDRHPPDAYAIGQPIQLGRVDHCARQCFDSRKCSLFSMDENEGTCQLYGAVMDTVITGDHHLRYYAFTGTKDRCPINDGYVMLRDVDMCIKVSRGENNYTEAYSECDSKQGGRLVVLEDEEKADAIVDITRDFDDWFFIGATRPDLGVMEFVWADGRVLVRDWWDDPHEPNGYGEQCVMTRNGRIYDNQCYTLSGFICEIAA